MNLINGNCLEELKKLPSNSVDLVICDLPYGVTACKWDVKIDLTLLWTELLRVGKPNTAYFFFCTFRFGIEIVNSNPKMFKYDLVWSKSACSNPLLTNLRFGPAHENILVFYKHKPTYNYLKYHTVVSSFPTKVHIYNVTGNRSNSVRRIYEPKLITSVLHHSNICGSHTKHTTQKPVPILETIIKYYSNEGDTVLDPTMGSGSTGEACKNLNRKFVGIELEEKIYRIATNRLLLK